MKAEKHLEFVCFDPNICKYGTNVYRNGKRVGSATVTETRLLVTVDDPETIRLMDENLPVTLSTQTANN